MRDAVITDVVRPPSDWGYLDGAFAGVYPVDLLAGVLSAPAMATPLGAPEADGCRFGLWTMREDFGFANVTIVERL